MVASASPSKVKEHQPGPAKACVRRLFSIWQTDVRFDRCNKQLRQRTRAQKIVKIESLIAQATKAASQGYSGFHQIINMLRPKTARGSIHFRDPSGALLIPGEELKTIADFSGICTTLQRIRPAYGTCRMHSVSHRMRPVVQYEQCLGIKHCPNIMHSALWRIAESSLAPALCRSINSRLQPGPIIGSRFTSCTHT